MFFLTLFICVVFFLLALLLHLLFRFDYFSIYLLLFLLVILVWNLDLILFNCRITQVLVVHLVRIHLSLAKHVLFLRLADVIIVWLRLRIILFFFPFFTECLIFFFQYHFVNLLLTLVFLITFWGLFLLFLFFSPSLNAHKVSGFLIHRNFGI